MKRAIGSLLVIFGVLSIFGNIMKSTSPKPDPTPQRIKFGGTMMSIIMILVGVKMSRKESDDS